MEESDQDDGFKVSDKRRFTPEGETRTENQAAEPEASEEIPPETEQESQSSGESAEEAGEFQPLDFSSLILSLGNTALFQLGLVQGPDDKMHKDLQGARQTIDIIAMLEEKTQGNLTEQEQRILRETLFQLRMAFVEASK